MVKLYLSTSKTFNYAECWVDEGIATVHEGCIGETGKTKTVKCEDEASFERLFYEEYLAKGYKEMPDEKKYWLIVQWPLKTQFGKPRDHRVKDSAIRLLNEGLGWAGVGEVDGWDVGKSANPSVEFVLNVACIVVDEKVGVKVVQDSIFKKLDCSKIKIATRPFDGEDYVLQYSANKGDTCFYE